MEQQPARSLPVDFHSLSFRAGALTLTLGKNITMDAISHALIPVLCVRLATKGPEWLGRWGLVYIGVSGALPDLLNPHLSLESRMISWSHGLPFWLGLSMAFLVTSLFLRDKFSPQLAACMSSAYLLHIACDAISGGIDLLYPFGTWVVGYYWVDPMLWIPIDIVLILVSYWLFRILPGLRKRKAQQVAS